MKKPSYFDMKKKKLLDVLEEIIADSSAGVYAAEPSDGGVLLLTKKAGENETKVTAACSFSDATLMLYGLGSAEAFKVALATAVSMLFKTDKEFLTQVATLMDDNGKLLEEVVSQFVEQVEKNAETETNKGFSVVIPAKKITS